MKTIRVRSANGRYDVLCGRGALSGAAALIGRLGRPAGTFLVSSPRVWKHCGARVETILRGKFADFILFDDREASKNLASVEEICRKLVRAGAGRDALVVAIGGGVVGDVAGFAAASYGRGIGLVHIPTTLVAQVDSAIGGKTGVNLPEGKNLVGAFYPPRLVLADPEFLRTLPPREFRSGVYEVIKYGVIGDVSLFGFLEEKMRQLLRGDKAALDFVITRSAEQKARVVSRDEKESGLREILNFGHTFAHALESVTRYRKYLHGEAVGMGMIAAARLAVLNGMLAARLAARIESVIHSVGTLPSWPAAAPARLAAVMQADKKTRAGQLRFVLPEGIGKVRCGVHVENRALQHCLRDCAAAMR